MADCDILDREPMNRATSPALSNTSELTTLSRSPSPVPDYYEFSRRVEVTVPLTPPDTPSNGQFTLHIGKRVGSPDMIRPRSLQEPQCPSLPKTPQSPRAPRSTNKYLEDAVLASLKSMLPTVAPWVTGKGGCGTLGVLPIEIRQKIYGLAFDISMPVSVKYCCGSETTPRERGACRKHGSRVATEAGRFNTLQVSKAMKSEALWVMRNQGLLLLKVDRALTQYLGCYRWNGQGRSLTSPLGNKRKTTMWSSVGEFRHVEIEVCKETLSDGNPVIQTSYLFEITSSLCQSWVRTSSSNVTAADSDAMRTAKVKLGSLFQGVLPFNTNSPAETSSWELNEWICRYCLLSGSEPDLDKIATDSGHNLLRLIAVIAKYCGHSKWKFVASMQLDEDDKGGLKWLRLIQNECAKHDMRLEDVDCE